MGNFQIKAVSCDAHWTFMKTNTPKTTKKRTKNTPEAWRWLKPAACEFQHPRFKQLSSYTMTSCPAPGSVAIDHSPSSHPKTPEAPSWIFCRSISPFPKARLLQLEVKQEWPTFCLLKFRQRKPSLNLSMSVLRHLDCMSRHLQCIYILLGTP